VDATLEGGEGTFQEMVARGHKGVLVGMGMGPAGESPMFGVGN
jgi:hypothetical protein